MSGESAPPKLLRIGDFARRTGTNLRTLRYYEELGLLAPHSRSAGGFRFYRESDENRLAAIRSLQELGLPLERIGELLGTRAPGLPREERLRRVRAALDAEDELLAERIRSLEKARSRIAAARAKLEECDSCVHVPVRENNWCEPCVCDGRALPEHLSALY